jgi:hypothetical protein
MSTGTLVHRIAQCLKQLMFGGPARAFTSTFLLFFGLFAVGLSIGEAGAAWARKWYGLPLVILGALLISLASLRRDR